MKQYTYDHYLAEVAGAMEEYLVWTFNPKELERVKKEAKARLNGLSKEVDK